MRTHTRRRLRPAGSRLALLVPAALTAALLALAGCSAAPAAGPLAQPRSTAIAAPAGGIARQDAGAVDAVAIGDSIAFGKGVAPGEAWPALISAEHGWRLTDLAVSGAGFVKPGWNGTSYRQQVDAALRLHPSVILLAATRNDRDEDPATVTAHADGMLRELREAFPHATIVGITGIWGSNEAPATMSRVDAIVGDAVRDVGGTWLDIGFPLAGHPDLVQVDGVHPNAAGQKVVARTIDAKLRPLNLAL